MAPQRVIPYFDYAKRRCDRVLHIYYQHLGFTIAYTSPIFIALDLQGDTESEYSLIYHNEGFRKYCEKLSLSQ